MEQTIGKRIMKNRKRLGLTQDALAEKLGVTAQAVSKWENDQSCPDITMLPKLAEIFGITTDELLGHESQTVHEAEIVEERDENEPEGVHIHVGDENRGNWDIHWDSGKKGSIFFAAFVLLTGCLTLLARVLALDVSFWSILWPSFLLCLGIHQLIGKFSFAGILGALLGGYFLVANLGIWELELSNQLIFPGILVLFGISLLVEALRKPKKPKFTVSRNGVKLGSKNGTTEFKNHFSAQENSFECCLSFGEESHTVDLPLLESGDISCAFGELTVDFSGCEVLSEDCEVEANCSFGELILLVPRRFRVEPDSSTAFASLDIQGQPDPVPQGTLRLDASVSFGEIQVKYI